MAKPRKQAPPPVGRCRALFQKIWRPIHKAWLAVADLRFNVVLLLFGILLACFLPPGRDVIATISDSWAMGGTGQWWLFLAAIWFLGLQVWLWSRLLLRLRHGESVMRRHRLLTHLPRLLGSIPYAAAAFAVATVPEGMHKVPQVALILLLGVLAYLFYWRRLYIVARLSKSWKTARRLLDEPGPLGLVRFELAVLVASLLLSLTVLVWLAVDPVALPLAIGSAALAFLAFALVVPVVNALLAFVRGEHFPVLTALLLVAICFSCASDNHEIRRLEGAASPDGRSSLDAAYLRWVDRAPRDLRPGHEAEVTAVLVTAAGGASRAGLWTLAALQRLDGDAMDPQFSRRIFAISAVSGSALGAVGYVAGIAAFEQDDLLARHELTWNHQGADFLAPALGGLFYTDLVQRFIPHPFLPDRAESIERGFEAAWDRECRDRQRPAPCADLMRGPFLDLWSGPRTAWRPNLLLVGAVEEDGRRIVTSNIDLVRRTPDGRPIRPLLPNVYDYFEITGRQVAASTAIMNSARFPWISPAGRIVDRDDNSRGHIIDGGYFETSGAETTENLAAALMETNMRLCPQVSRQCPRLNIVYLTLLNGDIIDNPRQPKRPACRQPGNRTVEEGSVDPDERLAPPCRRHLPIANDALAPLHGLLAAELGRATPPLTRLARLRSAEGLPIEIRLRPCRDRAERPLAMSWVLSELTRNRMQAQLRAVRLQPVPAPQPTGCLTRLQADMSQLARTLHIPMPPPRP
jgi:hypothetical protein